MCQKARDPVYAAYDEDRRNIAEAFTYQLPTKCVRRVSVETMEKEVDEGPLRPGKALPPWSLLKRFPTRRIVVGQVSKASLCIIPA